MTQNNPLDAPETPAPARSTFYKIHRVFFIVEAALWFLSLLSWYRGSLHWVLIFSLVLLMLYLLFPVLVFGSGSWRRHLLSHLAGIVLITAFVPALLVLESWEGTGAWLRFSFAGNLTLSLLTFAAYLKRRKTDPSDVYLLHIACSALMALVMNMCLFVYHEYY